MQQPKNWILLRGLARGTGHWGSFVERMKKHFPQDRFELIDLPGNGGRNEEQSPLNISEYVKDLRMHSEFVKKGQPFNILSVSLGSMVTVEWLREYPHEVQKAYLVCTSSMGFSSVHQRFLPANYLKAFQLLKARGDESEYEKVVLEMVTNSHARRQAEGLALMAYTKTHPMHFSNIVRQLIAASRYRFPKEAPGDIRLIGSYGDKLVSPKCTLKIGESWGVRPAMHPWAGHDIAIDDPDWLIEQLH
ncbi:MAG: alpha/beta fold hydrolase [Pseudobdellovibrionaceae bacterium]